MMAATFARRLVVGLLTVVALTTPAFGAGDPALLTVGMGGEVRSFDPHFGGDSDLQRWMPNSYDSLVELKPPDGATLAPNLATRWEVAPRPEDANLLARRGVKFSDGTDFNAEAVRVNVDRILKGKRGGPYSAPATCARCSAVDPPTRCSSCWLSPTT